MSLAEVTPASTYTGNGDIVLTNATLTWPLDESLNKNSAAQQNGTASAAATPKPGFTLADLSLTFPQGQISLICGRLGSGKTLLLSGLLGEADLLAGHISCPRSKPNAMSLSIDATKGGIAASEWIIPDLTAYVPQAAWLQNASIKDNVIFSSPFDRERYDKVLEACSLLTDLQILEDGDETYVVSQPSYSSTDLYHIANGPPARLERKVSI